MGTSEMEIFNHGWGARVLIHLPLSEAKKVLCKLQWRENHYGWRRSIPKGGTRWDLKGSAWLTGRRPSRSSGLRRRNFEWGTILHSLSIQEGPEAYALNIRGVRRSDLDSLMGNVLGLSEQQWSVTGWLVYERYVVLSTQDAHRLSGLLNGKSEKRSGRESAKEYLLRDSVPVKVKTRTKMHADVVLYRVDPSRGTTCAWKLEARLKGRSSSGNTFPEADAQRVLDGILTDIVEQHDLHPILKPPRWEPRDRTQPIESAPRLPALKGLLPSAYRGRKPTEADSNTPFPFIWFASAVPMRSSCTQTGISVGHLRMFHGLNQKMDSSLNIQDWYRKVRQPWDKLSDEIVSLPSGKLTEVVIPHFQSAGPFIKALAEKPNVKMALSFLTSEIYKGMNPACVTGHEIGELLLEHPVCIDDATHWVLVIDSQVFFAVQGQLPGRPPAAAISSHFASLCREWRQLSEETGLNITLVTYDARPTRGKAYWQSSHNFRDTRVRSLLGDATRYYCHMRYLFEGYEIEGPQWVACTKDNVHGMGPGRIIWSDANAGYGKLGKLLAIEDLLELEESRKQQEQPIMLSDLDLLDTDQVDDTSLSAEYLSVGGSTGEPSDSCLSPDQVIYSPDDSTTEEDCGCKIFRTLNQAAEHIPGLSGGTDEQKTAI